MARRNLLLTFLLLLSLGFSAWLIQQTTASQTIATNNQPDTPDSFMIEATYLRMDVNGNVDTKIYTPKLLHYRKNDASEFVHPEIVIFNKDNRMPWQVTAEQGKSEHGTTQIVLWDNVKIHQNAGPNNREITILTPALTVYPEPQTAETDKPVTITQPGTVIKSVGLRADMKKGQVQLLSQATGVYNASDAK